jgi:hypothetical protein
VTRSLPNSQACSLPCVTCTTHYCIFKIAPFLLDHALSAASTMELQDRLAADLLSTSVNDDGLGITATPWTQGRQLIPEDGQRQLHWNNMDTSGNSSFPSTCEPFLRTSYHECICRRFRMFRQTVSSRKQRGKLAPPEGDQKKAISLTFKPSRFVSMAKRAGFIFSTIVTREVYGD